MAQKKYGKYLTREIIADSKYAEITAPIARYTGCRGGGQDALEAEWSCITQPVVMDQEPEVDPDCDQLLLIGSTNVRDSGDFHAEVEIALGPNGKKQTIAEPAWIYIPKGYKHGPITVKSVDKPIFVLRTRIAAKYSPGWDVKNESDCVFFPMKKQAEMMAHMPPPGEPMPPDITVIHPPSTPFRYARLPIGQGLGYMLLPTDLGWPVKVSPMYISQLYREYCSVEPVHAHRESHQISMYIGADPLDIEDFDADLDVFMGKELERQTLDSCGVVHYVPGCPHVGDEVRYVTKPFIHIMWVVGPHMENYYAAAEKDKVLLSDEMKGEVMITPGAGDYVPPTKMEDYVWPYPSETK